MNKSELNKVNEIAAKEFHYEGEEHFGGVGNLSYIGGRDEFDYGGNGNTFAQEYAKGRTFSFKIVNATGQDELIALSPAYYDTLARLSAEGHGDVTAIFGDGSILNRGAGLDLTCTSLNSGKSIFGFLEFIKRNPLRVIGFSLQSTITSQLDQIVKVENVSPLYDLGNKNIVLSTYRPASQLSVDKIDANLIADDNVIDFNDQNLVKFPIVDGATVTLNLFIGAIDNRPLKLKKRASAAHNNIRARHPEKCGR